MLVFCASYTKMLGDKVVWGPYQVISRRRNWWMHRREKYVYFAFFSICNFSMCAILSPCWAIRSQVVHDWQRRHDCIFLPIIHKRILSLRWYRGKGEGLYGWAKWRAGIDDNGRVLEPRTDNYLYTGGLKNMIKMLDWVLIRHNPFRGENLCSTIDIYIDRGYR